METLRDILTIIGGITVSVAAGALGAFVVVEIYFRICMMSLNRKDKKSSKFGRYPSCDMLNNAIRFLHNGDTDNAMIEIIFAIDKAGGYFHEDNIEMVNIAKQKWKESHS